MIVGAREHIIPFAGRAPKVGIQIAKLNGIAVALEVEIDGPRFIENRAWEWK